MYLSRIKLDINKKSTQIALASLNRLHGAIEEAFDYRLGERKRNLWRLDQVNGNLYLMLLSGELPKFDGIVRQFGYGVEDCYTKSYDAFLSKIENDSYWRFRLVANPTISKSTGNKDRGKRVAIVSVKYQKEWLVRQAVQNGFLVEEETFDVMESKWVSFCKKQEHTIKAISVTYEGILQVTDAEKFRNALLHGIGREKAYGMGLLTIMKS